MDHVLTSLYESLRAGRSVVLATIIMDKGSTPRTAGSRMLIHADGSITGTIGGGLVEAEVMRAANDLFQSGGAKIRSFDLRSAEAAQSVDMICGGLLEVLVEHVEAGPDSVRLYAELLETLRAGRSCLLVSALPEPSEGAARIQRCLRREDGETLGPCPVAEPELRALVQSAGDDAQARLLHHAGRQYLVEPFHAAATLYLFGAGHVSRQTAAVAARVGFRTVVVDDRAEFANAERFPDASEIHVLPSFQDPLQGLTINRRSFLVIVTRGHSHDKTVLGHALKTDARYIGMIGSRRKRDSIYRLLLEEGFSREDLDRVHCPIGLDIGAETPEEIGVSIVAELIAVRAGRQQRS